MLFSWREQGPMWLGGTPPLFWASTLFPGPLQVRLRLSPDNPRTRVVVVGCSRVVAGCPGKLSTSPVTYMTHAWPAFQPVEWCYVRFLMTLAGVGRRVPGGQSATSCVLLAGQDGDGVAAGLGSVRGICPPSSMSSSSLEKSPLRY